MLKPNFKSPAVCSDLSLIAIGVVLVIGGVFWVMCSDPFRMPMLIPGMIGLIFFVTGIIALIVTVRHEHWVEEEIQKHNATDNPIKLKMAWW